MEHQKRRKGAGCVAISIGWKGKSQAMLQVIWERQER